MLAADLHRTLRKRLDPDPSLRLAPGDRAAAVLALVVQAPEPAVVFTERAATLRRHAGEISFPGGLAEPGDASLAETALREAHEEIGLDPALPDVLGALPAVHTFVSGILVAPFVGVVPTLPPLHPMDGEIARVLVEPLAALAEAEQAVTWTRPGGARWTGWVYEVAGGTVWGATGGMVHELLGATRGVLA